MLPCQLRSRIAKALSIRSAIGFLVLGCILNVPLGLHAQIREAKLEDLVKQLTANDRDDQRDAVYELARRRADTPEVIEGFAKLANERDEQIQFQALMGLARAGAASEPAIPELFECLRDRSAQARYRAVVALGCIGETAVPSILEHWSKASSNEKSGLAHALGMIGKPAEKALPKLKEALEDGNDLLRRFAAEAVASIVGESEKDLLDLARNQDDTVRLIGIRAIAGIPNPGKDVESRLAEALEDTDPNVREAIVVALGKSKVAPDEKARLFARAIVDSAYPVRAGAAAMIENAGLRTPEFAQQVAAQFSEVEEPEVLATLIQTLGSFREQAAATLPAIVETATTKNVSADLAAETIAKLGKDAVLDLLDMLEKTPDAAPIASRCLVLLEDASEVLKTGLESPLPVLRVSCANALSDLRPVDNSSFDRLVELLSDEDASVRVAATDAVASIVKDTQPDPSQYNAQIKPLESDPDAAVRAELAKNVLHLRLNREEEIRLSEQALADEDALVRAAAIACVSEDENLLKRLLPTLIKLSVDEDVIVRANACSAFGELSKDNVTEEVGNALLNCLADTESGVRILSTDSIASLRYSTPKILEAMEKNLADDEDLLRATLFAFEELGRSANSTSGSIANLVSHPAADIRVSSLVALASVQDKKESLIPTLIEALHDKEWIVRRQACEELAELGKSAKEAIPTLMPMIAIPEDESIATSTIREIDAAPEASVSELIDYIDSEDGRTKYYAIFLLGKIGPPAKEALPHLERAKKEAGDSRRAGFIHRAVDNAVKAIDVEQDSE